MTNHFIFIHSEIIYILNVIYLRLHNFIGRDRGNHCKIIKTPTNIFKIKK